MGIYGLTYFITLGGFSVKYQCVDQDEGEDVNKTSTI